MRPLEITIIALNALSLLARLHPPFARRGPLLFSGLGFAALLAHGVIEGPRWQMIPLYVLTAFLFVLAVRPFYDRAPRRRPATPRKNRGWAAAGLAAVALFSLPPLLLPVPTFPDPGGPYEVGTTTFYWEDASREEQYAAQPGGPRRLNVQVWYPAGPRAAGRLSPWVERIDIVSRALAEQNGLPPKLAEYVALARTHSRVDAPILPGGERFPVLVFSHGWTGLRSQNTYQVEMLASHGYVVIAPDHTYGAAATVFPNGEVALNNPDALPGDVSDAEYDAAARRLGAAWMEDLRFVLDQAGRLDAGQIESIFAGRLALERVGMLGHSTGAGAVTEACWVDERCDAVLGMDPWLVPYSREMAAAGLDAPLMFIFSEHWNARRNAPLAESLFAASRGERYRLTLSGAVHYDFTDIPAFSPLSGRMGYKGDLPARRTHAAINAYTLAFFDRYLQGAGSPLLDGPSEAYPEMRWE